MDPAASKLLPYLAPLLVVALDISNRAD